MTYSDINDVNQPWNMSLLCVWKNYLELCTAMNLSVMWSVAATLLKMLTNGWRTVGQFWN